MRHLNPPTLSAPRGYSHVVEVTSGRTLYVSGQIAVDPDGRVVGAGDFEAQTRQVFENLKAALAAAEATLADVVKITMFVTDIAQLPTLRAVRDAYFTGAPPASSLVEVSRLVLPELMVEIEAIAVTGSPRRDPT
jgi:reactive intermediate/imine deaminase